MKKSEKKPIFCPYPRMIAQGSCDFGYMKKSVNFRTLLDFQVFFVTSGIGIIHLDNREIPIRSGGLYLIQPGIYHAYSFQKANFIYIHFDLFYHKKRENSYVVAGGNYPADTEKSYMQLSLNTYLNKSLPVEIFPANFNKVEYMFQNALHLFTNTPPLWQLKLQGLLAEILTIYTENTLKSSDSFTLDLDEKLGRALVYIKENLNRTITLNELARISILSPSHLSHEFKKKYKISPMKMHKKNRMQAIRNRLVNVNATLSELADEYGYSNSFSLSRGIKKNFGSSPRAIKKLNS